MMERTLVLIKPDALQRGLVGAVLSRLEGRGLKLVAMKMIHMDAALARKHYAIHEGKPFFQGLVDFITSAPVVACVFEGTRAVEVVRRTMGETDPARATPGTIRGDWGLDIGRNLVHGSDSGENAEQEIALFFTPEEILSYTMEVDRWVFE
jgi:nucleoside-diphosphate kinase